MGAHATRREDLTAAEIAQVERNGELAEAALDELLADRIAHRAEGCHDWYCTSEGEPDRIAHYEHHQLAQLLAVALHRLSERGAS